MGSKNKNKNKITTGNSTNGAKKMSDDPRFAKVQSDPRFQNFPNRKAKVSIDPRFSRMFTDERFATSSAPVDKRGKRKDKSENALKRYYQLEDEDVDKKVGEVKKRREKVEESEDESGSYSEPEPVSVSKSESEEEDDDSVSESEEDSESDDDDDSTTSTSDTDDDVDGVEMFGEEASLEVENVPMIEEETHRLAVVNMDWDQVKAVDLFMVLKSFLPSGGQIKSVAVYPSDFGLKRMEEEAVRGPVALFNGEGKDDEDDDDEMDAEKLREYEKSRLRYYYAVVECDSAATANHLYKGCDGTEFERSSNVMDLRFIPDSMEFQHPPRDVAAEAPADYDGLDFLTAALQHSNVDLSWDNDEPHRAKKLKRKFNEKRLDEMEFEEFLASDESDSDEDENGDEDPSEKKKKKAEKYRSALLEPGDGSDENDNDNLDMEVTFNPDLEDLSTKVLEKNKDKKSKSAWEEYLTKKKEKRKAKKHRSKNSSDDESDESYQDPPEQPDDFFEEEPSGKGSKVTHSKTKRTLEDKDAEASRAELELLLADENGTDNKPKGYKIKQKKAKGKKGKEAPDEDKLPTVDYDDPRFSALFTNPAFALDPTDPQFKRSATYFRQVAQRQQKGREENSEKQPAAVPTETPDVSYKKEEKEKHELSAIVRSIKMKSQQLHVSSGVGMKKDKLKDKMEASGSETKGKKHKLSNSDRSMKKKAKV